MVSWPASFGVAIFAMTVNVKVVSAIHESCPLPLAGEESGVRETAMTSMIGGSKKVMTVGQAWSALLDE